MFPKLAEKIATTGITRDDCSVSPQTNFRGFIQCCGPRHLRLCLSNFDKHQKKQRRLLKEGAKLERIGSDPDETNGPAGQAQKLSRPMYFCARAIDASPFIGLMQDSIA